MRMTLDCGHQTGAMKRRIAKWLVRHSVMAWCPTCHDKRPITKGPQP